MHRHEINPFRGNTATHLRRLERMAALRGDVAPLANVATESDPPEPVPLEYAPPPETRRARARRLARAALRIVSEPFVLSILLGGCALLFAVDLKSMKREDFRLLCLVGGVDVAFFTGLATWARKRREDANRW